MEYGHQETVSIDRLRNSTDLGGYDGQPHGHRFKKSEGCAFVKRGKSKYIQRTQQFRNFRSCLEEFHPVRDAEAGGLSLQTHSRTTVGTCDHCANLPDPALGIVTGKERNRAQQKLEILFGSQARYGADYEVLRPESKSGAALIAVVTTGIEAREIDAVANHYDLAGVAFQEPTLREDHVADRVRFADYTIARGFVGEARGETDAVHALDDCAYVGVAGRGAGP